LENQVSEIKLYNEEVEKSYSNILEGKMEELEELKYEHTTSCHRMKI
jgi:hypothetical protein